MTSNNELIRTRYIERIAEALEKRNEIEFGLWNDIKKLMGEIDQAIRYFGITSG